MRVTSITKKTRNLIKFQFYDRQNEKNGTMEIIIFHRDFSSKFSTQKQYPVHSWLNFKLKLYFGFKTLKTFRLVLFVF